MSNYRKRLAITITGEDEDGLCCSLDEVRRKIEDGFTSGFDRNKTDDYEFSLDDDLNHPLAPAIAGDN